jgi:GDP-4-dehydro-6-deoxy-D-mannose reductase
VLVTGGSGFAGAHLVAACAAAGDEVVALARAPGPAAAHRWIAADLADPGAARRAVREASPAVVHHLAARAFVPAAWRDPAATLQANTATTLNLLEAVRLEAPDAAVVVASSGEVYGPPARLPVDEDAALRPQNPYAVSKAAADLLAGFYADAHGLRVVRARAFNHAGPGQGPDYAVSSFARQAAGALVAGEGCACIVTGNPAPRRDYTDVRDVARAYRLLGEGAAPGPYNVCSGRSASVAEIVALLGEVTGLPVVHDVDPALVREHEVLDVRGDPRRLRKATGWSPSIPLRRTLEDTVAWWRARLEREEVTAGE